LIGRNHAAGIGPVETIEGMGEKPSLSVKSFETGQAFRRAANLRVINDRRNRGKAAEGHCDGP
jgi:hypothetical protein